jgi:integrase
MGGNRVYDGVRIASESTIEIDFRLNGKRCRERIKLEPTPANLRRAAQHRAAILAAIDAGTFDYATTFPGSKRAPQLTAVPGRALTVTAYLERWLDRRRPTLKSSTWGGYNKIINGHLIPAFGARMLADLTRTEIKTWAAKLTAGNKAIANITSVLRAALQEAFEDELIESNPLAGWVYRKTEPPRESDEVDPFTAEEQAAILAALDGQGRNLIQFALWTGLRTSELVALTWADVDWRRGVIQIRRAQTQAARHTGPETTKTRSGLREVKILPPALEALTLQKPWTWLKGEEVFQNPRTRERWAGDQPIRKTLWTHALKRADVRYRNPYQTRHTYASMMLSAGEHPLWVAQQMGHADWGMIRRIYGKWMPDADTQAGSRAVEMFGGGGAGKKTKTGT